METYCDLQNNIMLSAKVLVLIRPFFMMSFWLGHLYDVREVSREEIETLSHILLKLPSLIFASSLSVQRNLISRLCWNIKIFMGEGSIFGHKVNFLVQTLSESVEISMDSILWKLDEKLWLCTKNATCWHNQKYVYIIAMTSNTTTNYCCAPKMPLVDILEKYDFFIEIAISNA